MPKTLKVTTLNDYAPVIGDEAVERITNKAKALNGLHVTNVNSTGYGGGVAEILSSMTLLMNSVGIETGWRTIIGRPDFFLITKNMHNALQSGEMDLTDEKKEIYEQVVYENAVRTHLDKHDLVVIHDPQPLPIINHYKKTSPWVWRIHIDLSNPHPQLWQYLKGFVEKYDAVVASIPEYNQQTSNPWNYFMPAIDPLSAKNRDYSEGVMNAKLKEYDIPTNKPLIVQVSRFDHWKDPKGVIEAFKIARKKVDGTLVLLGNAATDDPEGEQVYQDLLKNQSDEIRILPFGDDTVLVNTLQKKADIVMQKSIREGFGLTVTEAMWKGTPVIGGDCGGIRYQIADGESGYLVSSVEQAADRIVKLIEDDKLREEMGRKARESVREKFLLSRLLEQYIDLFASLTK